jgi:nicotinamidase-related amidase
MAQNVQLLVIDPQHDFMDEPVAGMPDSTLSVPGATADMVRLAAMVDRVGDKLDDIHVTLDSHHLVDVGHPTMWRAADGKTPPPPFTAILSDDIKAGIWTPRNANAKPPQLGGETIKQCMIRYAAQLEAQGSHLLMVWPVHCLIGSPGHSVQADLMTALNRWADRSFANVDFVTKGTNPYTEHYGALQAEVPMASDPSTGLHTGLLDVLQAADILVIAGEALTHCLMETVRQIANNVDEKLISKFHLLTDATSPIPAVPGGPDFPAMAQKWQDEMVARGMVLTTTTEFLA